MYEHRHSNLDKRFPTIPEWNGEDLSSKKILVYNEQGIGDAIQFSKYLINLNKNCKNIDFLVNQNLYDLFDTSGYYGLNLITKNNIDLDKYNFKISLGSLIKFFYKDFNLTTKNLIKVDFDQINSYKKEIDSKKLNIGIAWSGNFYGPKEPHRSIPLDKFKEIISPDFNFYCLQNEIWESDQKIFNQINVINKGNLKLKALSAFIHNLDLVISSDTSILHLAASLGKETWAVLSLDPDWRWGKFIEFYKYENIKFYATPTPFRHLGFFPDQSPHWIWAAQKIKKFILNAYNSNPPRVLNLFGYSGLASLHAASSGASVTHVDASKKAINFAFENRDLSSFSNLPIKYLTDDALKFVNREIRRGNTYDAIILDPPKYGRGPNGEKWELQKDLPILLNLLPQILSENPLFVILNSYAIRSSYSSLYYALREVMKTYKGKVEAGEVSIVEDQDDPREISTAIFARWEY